jgi:hypothetical protein
VADLLLGRAPADQVLASGKLPHEPGQRLVREAAGFTPVKADQALAALAVELGDAFAERTGDRRDG